MSGGLTERGGIPFGPWQCRSIDLAWDLGFVQEARRGDQGGEGSGRRPRQPAPPSLRQGH